MRTYSLALLALGLASAAHAQSADFAITGAKVYIGDGKVLDSATVVVKNGKIDSVSTDAAPAGLTAIDGKGKVLYPGFIDAYSTRLTKTPPNPSTDGKPDIGVEAPPYMWIGNHKGIYSDFPSAPNLDFDKDTSAWDSGITAALVIPRQGSIRGAGAVINILPAADKDARVLDDSFGFGMSYRNGGGEGYPSNILGVIALMRQTLADAKSLAEGANLAKPDDKAPWKKALEDLKPLVTGQKPAVFELNMDREIARTFHIADEFGFKFMVAGGRDAYKMIPDLKARQIPVLYTIDNLIEPSVEPDKADTDPADVTPIEYKKERHDRWEEQINGIADIAKSGLPFAFGTSSAPAQYLESIRGFIKHGLDKDLALKAMTINPATILGVQSKLGTIETGKLASLVLMSGEFTDEKSKVERVWVAGKPVVEPKKEGGK